MIPQLDIQADAIFTDPPYSSGGTFRGDRTGQTSTKYQSTEQRGTYAEFTGDNRDQRSFQYWATLWLGACRALAKPSAYCAIFTDWRQLPIMTDAFQAGGWVWRGIVAWDKTEAARPQNGYYRNQCEYIVWGTNGVLVPTGIYAPGVFRYSVFGEERLHMTGKPVALMIDLLQLVQGHIICDPFMGSGSTAIAAINLGKCFVGIEIDPHWHSVACRRIEAAYKQPDLFLPRVPSPAPRQEPLFVKDHTP